MSRASERALLQKKKNSISNSNKTITFELIINDYMWKVESGGSVYMAWQHAIERRQIKSQNSKFYLLSCTPPLFINLWPMFTYWLLRHTHAHILFAITLHRNHYKSTIWRAMNNYKSLFALSFQWHAAGQQSILWIFCVHCSAECFLACTHNNAHKWWGHGKLIDSYAWRKIGN